MAVAVSGCVVIGTNGDVATYQKKCDKCGHVESSKLKTPTRSKIYNGSFVCPKCKNHQKIVIRM